MDAKSPFLAEGEMGALIRGYDWASTSIGPLSKWPQSLRTTVSIMLRSPIPMVLLWGPDGIMIYNDAYVIFSAGRHPSLLGSPVLDGWPEVADFNANVMRVGMAGGTLSYQDQELTLYRKGVPEQVWMNLDYSPVLDESGRPGGVLAIVVETTERVQVEQALVQTQERLSYALNAAGMVGTFYWHIPSDILYADARFAAMFSLAPEKGATGAPVGDYLAAIHPDDVDRVSEAVNHTISTGEKLSIEYRLLGEAGLVRWVEVRGECLYDGEGKPVRFPGAAVEITGRKQIEEAQSLLLRELNHRVKNLFAVVNGMVALTARTASTPKEMAATLRERLDALARANDLIRPSIVGEAEAAEEGTTLEALIRTVLSPYLDETRAHGREGLILSGPAVPVGGDAVTGLALVLHETTTNAAKYGALSSPQGSIEIAWAVQATFTSPGRSGVDRLLLNLRTRRALEAFW